MQTVIGLRGSVGTDSPFQSMFAADPVQSINYVSSHDNLTLYDKIGLVRIQDFPVSFDYKKRIAGFANSIVFMSQGVAKFHSGAEFLRTKFGIDNSYNSPDSVNQIDWTLKEKHWSTFDYYRHVIFARKRFEGLRLGTADEIWNNVSVNYLDGGLFEVKVAPEGSRKELIVLLNSGFDRSYNLPSGSWTAAVEGGVSSRDRVVSGTITAAGTAVTLLYR